MNYSFDYDNTLIKYKYIYSPTGEIIDVVYDRPHDQNINIVRELHESGHNIYIITSRIKPIYEGFRYEWDESPSPEKLVKELSLPIKQIIYTNGRKKIEKLILFNIQKHWDDDEAECEEIMRYNPNFINKKIEYVLVQKQKGITVMLRDKFLRLTKNEV